MPFGIGTNTKAPLKLSKKRTYTVQGQNVPPQGDSESLHRIRGGGRRNSTPAGILKRGGLRPVSYPALEDARGMVPQEMAAAIPMPKEAELNEMFAEMVVSTSEGE